MDFVTLSKPISLCQLAQCKSLMTLRHSPLLNISSIFHGHIDRLLISLSTSTSWPTPTDFNWYFCLITLQQTVDICHICHTLFGVKPTDEGSEGRWAHAHHANSDCERFSFAM